MYDTQSHLMTTMNGTACDDGDPGTTNDVCTDGVCAGTTGPPLDCPCMHDSHFASFVNNINSDMCCVDNTVGDEWEFIVYSQGCVEPSARAEVSAMFSICSCENMLLITPAQALDCKEILSNATAEAQLDCSN